MAVYAEAVVQEARLWSPFLSGRRARTVFFGGGTPSLMPAPLLRRILDALRSCLEVSLDAEVSLEANPGTVDQAQLESLRAAGFNRISFGVQSFHDDELRQLERVHDAQEVEDAYRWARLAGFDNVNLDLIFGLIGQSKAAWQENIERALALEPDHLSLYALTLEEGTPLTRDVERGRRPAPDYDLQADMYEWNRQRLPRDGFHQYEISNWAKPGRECRHNLVYWHNGDWLGLGAGAHSHLGGQRFAAAPTPSRYIALVNETAAAGAMSVDEMRQVTYREPFDAAREMSETVILALRLREGLSLAEFEDRFGLPLGEAFPAALEETLRLGLTEIVDGRLRLRDEAVLLGDEAFMRFLPD